MNEIDTEKQVLSRKQFLSIIGSAIAGVLFSQFFFSSKQTYKKENSYGSSNYGNRT